MAVIGHTGRGNYGHGLDTVWLAVPECRVVAVADADETGLAAAVKRLGKPQGVSRLPRDARQGEAGPGEHLPALARPASRHGRGGAERGVRGIYLEKPLCRTLAEADEMVAACEKHNVKLAIAHPDTLQPEAAGGARTDPLGQAGPGAGVPRPRQGRPPRRRRGPVGAGHARVESHSSLRRQAAVVLRLGRAERPADPPRRREAGRGRHRAAGRRQGPRHVPPGRRRDGLFRFGPQGRRAAQPLRPADLRLARRRRSVRHGHLPTMYFLPDSTWIAGPHGKRPVPISSAGVGKAEPLANGGLPGGNVLAVRDLIAAIEKDRQPPSSIYEARTATEMIVAVFESQRLGKPVALPLAERQNPLSLL